MSENDENDNDAPPEPDKTIKTESHFERPPKPNKKIIARIIKSADPNNEQKNQENND